MRMIPDAERVFEPDPAMPAGAVPIFGEYQDRLARWMKDKIAWAILPAPIGIALFFAHVGLAAPVALVVVSTIRTLSSGRIAWACVLPKRLKSQTFRRVDCLPETLMLAGRTVGVPLADGKWLRIRWPEPWRAQLAWQGRLWLLGSDERVFAVLPGSLWVRRARIGAAPPRGAARLPAVSRTFESPRHDPVLGSYRRLAAGRYLRVCGFLALLTALSVWIRVDFPPGLGFVSRLVGGLSVLFAVCCGLMAVHAASAVQRSGKPLPVDRWTELHVVPDGPVRPRGRGCAQLTGRTMLADGGEVEFRIRRAAALAANVAQNGQLWVAGAPRLGKVMAGVPGHAVWGAVEFRASAK